MPDASASAHTGVSEAFSMINTLVTGSDIDQTALQFTAPRAHTGTWYTQQQGMRDKSTRTILKYKKCTFKQ